MNKTGWIIIGTTFIICALFGFLVTKAQVTSAYQMLRDTAKAKNDLNEMGQKKEILSQLAANNQLVNLNDIASKYIPTEPDSSQLILELSAIAGQNNLKVAEFTLENTKASTAPKTDTTATTDTAKTATTTPAPATDATATAGISEIPFSMKLSGSFNDYLNFLNSVQGSSRLVMISAMDLKQDTASFSSQITGKAYYKKATGLDKTLANITISPDIINKFLNLKTYSAPINLPAESGFGRTNPFEGI